ncbi:uncharacterized protein K489DRAFT_316921 [Dissoconium aciculare CBS 342.82]|uniref:Uncharacterized protein n=1 Tax=Dissoconium aciculare CBS 342.82 TaxID=1314786 RepID=A0A6J3M8F9_9PEZI|nr:uncharacterized protein K489DRAFT_316921 [Dissoconium aciculare CBS 342.82]KAF1824280.1 hypothetical protein K489DRAFT_316921 [Dissoconium aciculare CBS 342.82]
MAATDATGGRPRFEPVDTSFGTGFRDDVESPSLSSSNALARFEFEPGRSKEGTKVLMVEWQEDATSRAISADWEISWDGKKTVLPAKDSQKQQAQSQRPLTASELADEPINRMYFLLLPGMPIPTTVRLQKGPTLAWRTNPLPAIFAPELGATALESGKKGVLHTHWAKKRLQVLQAEISAEERNNSEGVGLEMARAEMEWIEQNFGVQARPVNISLDTTGAGATTGVSDVNNLNTPSSPRSPGGGRLMDKLKGLKLGTSDRELQTPLTATSTAAGAFSDMHNPLSPETSDVAVGGGGFGSFLELKGAAPTSSLAAKPAQQPTAADEDDDDDLFALPMSPRSPEMTKSPFSFAAQDVGRYAKGERA